MTRKILRRSRAIKLRILAFFLVVILCLTSCAEQSIQVLSYDLDYGDVISIDPQYTTDTTAYHIIYNTMEGLYTPDEYGMPTPAIATDYSVEGSVYTFYLKEDAKWSDSSTLTAHDFEFAFKRMFNTDAPSPHSYLYADIQNATEIYANNLPSDMLGVKALDDFTLEITLTAPNPYFLRILALPSSMPCNEDFLNESRGRYGMSKDDMLYNGAFSISKWNSTAFTLGKNEFYHDTQSVIPSVLYLYTSTENPIENFTEGNTSALLLPFESDNDFPATDYTKSSFDNAVWAITYNQNSPYFSHNQIREAFSYALSQSDISSAEIPGIINTNSFIPDFALEEPLDYKLKLNNEHTSSASNLLNLAYDNYNISSTPKLTLLLPDNEVGNIMSAYLQSVWGSALSIFINYEFLSEQDLLSRNTLDSYDFALLPYYYQGDTGISLLETFTPTGANPANYHNVVFESLVDTAKNSTQPESYESALSAAESILFDSNVIYPLYTTSTIFLTQSNIQNIKLLSFGTVCYFKYATVVG